MSVNNKCNCQFLILKTPYIQSDDHLTVYPDVKYQHVGDLRDPNPFYTTEPHTHTTCMCTTYI